MRNRLPAGASPDAIDTACKVRAEEEEVWWRRILPGVKSPARLAASIREAEDEVVSLAAAPPELNAVGVFVVFDSEAGQREVLERMSFGKWREGEVGAEWRLEGRALRVVEPDEPLSVLWCNLEDTVSVSFVVWGRRRGDRVCRALGWLFAVF